MAELLMVDAIDIPHSEIAVDTRPTVLMVDTININGVYSGGGDDNNGGNNNGGNTPVPPTPTTTDTSKLTLAIGALGVGAMLIAISLPNKKNT